MIQRISRAEWLDRHPTIKQYIVSNPHDWFTAPQFNLWPDASLIEGISEHQRDNLTKSLAGRIGILGGSPGTGKTFTVAKLIRYMLESSLVGSHEIGIGAPTGKAAVRLTEMLQRSGLPLRARTWHSLLGIGANSETGGWSFKHSESYPLPFRVLIGDESSMMDLSLMLSVLRARQPGCHVLMVGDVNQLPPVGAGAPLRDMILAGLPYGELTEIKRNSGGIVEACAAIRDGRPWRTFTQASGTNLRMHEAGIEFQVDRAIKLIRESQKAGHDPIWDCQVLVAINEKSLLSRKAVNALLQDELNPGPKFEGTEFKPRDKVVCLKNGFYKAIEAPADEEIQSNERGEVYVANGELAEVVAIEASEIIVELESPARVVAIPLRRGAGEDEKGAAGNWDLGYALSGHKSQGSEWPVVITIIDPCAGAKMVCDRSWLYTAISRASQVQHLVGHLDIAERFCRTQKINQRKTFLREKIGIELFKKEWEE